MALPRTASRERLEAMGVALWVRRDRRAARQPGAPRARAADPTGSTTDTAGARLRLASGDGDWLLVRDRPWDGRHDALLGDIQATIGSARCRFGQWAHSDSAGVGLDELSSRGIRHVLAFGQPPADAGGDVVHVVPDLETLAKSADARRRLWRSLAGELGD